MTRDERGPLAERPPRRRYAWQLGEFRGSGYSKGRGIVWQALWFATQHLVFAKWWCPAALRVAILRAFGANVGTGVLIRHRVRVHWPWKLTIGDHCWIGEGGWLLNLEEIVLRDNVCVSQDAFLCTGGHDPRSPSFEYDNGSISVGASSWIAARAIVLRGTDVPGGAVVPAGAVVSRRHFW